MILKMIQMKELNPWLDEECTPIDKYCKIVLEFGRYKAGSERAKQKLKEARTRWIKEQLERIFKDSKAYKRYVVHDTN
jgi:hypothetical protein